MTIDVPNTFKNDDGVQKLEGLCGNFDGNTVNELEGHQTINEFGHAWKARDPCPNIADDQCYDPCAVGT